MEITNSLRGDDKIDLFIEREGGFCPRDVGYDPLRFMIVDGGCSCKSVDSSKSGHAHACYNNTFSGSYNSEPSKYEGSTMILSMCGLRKQSNEEDKEELKLNKIARVKLLFYNSGIDKKKALLHDRINFFKTVVCKSTDSYKIVSFDKYSGINKEHEKFYLTSISKKDCVLYDNFEVIVYIPRFLGLRPKKLTGTVPESKIVLDEL